MLLVDKAKTAGTIAMKLISKYLEYSIKVVSNRTGVREEEELYMSMWKSLQTKSDHSSALEIYNIRYNIIGIKTWKLVLLKLSFTAHNRGSINLEFLIKIQNKKSIDIP